MNDTVAIEQKPLPCACRFEWRQTPDFSGSPPVQLDQCGFHSTQKQALERERDLLRQMLAELVAALEAVLDESNMGVTLATQARARADLEHAKEQS